MLFPVGGNRGKMPDDITALITLLHVWNLDLAEYIAMTQGVGGGGQGNLEKSGRLLNINRNISMTFDFIIITTAVQ